MLNKTKKLDELMHKTEKLLGTDYNRKNYNEDERYNKWINMFNIVHNSKNHEKIDFLLHIAWQGYAIEKELRKERFSDEFNQELIDELFENMYDIIVEYMNSPRQD